MEYTMTNPGDGDKPARKSESRSEGPRREVSQGDSRGTGRPQGKSRDAGGYRGDRDKPYVARSERPGRPSYGRPPADGSRPTRGAAADGRTSSDRRPPR